LKANLPVAEGAPGSLLPSVIRPEYSVDLQYEQDRIFEHLRGAQMDSQSVTYLQHTGNTNAAAVTAENATILDVGAQVTPKTVNAVAIKALASVSLEAMDDFGFFSSWLPRELRRAVIDAETSWLVNASQTGIIWQATPPGSGCLTRLIGADTPITAVAKAIR